MDQIEASIIALGNRVGEPQRAKLLADRLRARREQLAERLEGISKRPRVLFWSAGFTAGLETTIDDIIREAGAINAAAEIGMKGSAEISPERVIAIDPDVILLGRWKADDRDGDIKNHVLLRNLRAVTENRVVTVEGRYLICVSQFVVEGAERLARALHPESFADVPVPSDTSEGTTP